MSNFRKLKSKINKKFVNIGKKGPIPKGLGKSSKKVGFIVYPIDYDFLMEEYNWVGEIFLDIKEEVDNSFTLIIEGTFGQKNMMIESVEYAELKNEINGSMKDILRFFDEFTKELNYDFTSLRKLADFLNYYKLTK